MALYDLGEGGRYQTNDPAPDTTQGAYSIGQQLPKTTYPSGTTPQTQGFDFGNPTYNTIGGYFKTATGQDPTLQQVSQWGTNVDQNYLSQIQKAIYGTPQAQAYQIGGQQTAASPTTAAPTGTDLRSQLSGVFQRYGLDPSNPGSGLGNIDYFLQRANETNPNDTTYWTQRLAQEIEKAQTGKVGNLIDTGQQGNFSDPVTAQWEQALNQLVGKLNQPYQAPGMDNLLKYLQDYATKLQGPAYTPQEMDTLQTQALDPLSAQRDAMRQQIIQRAAARGLNPDSGIVQDEINQADRALQQARSQRQGQFASNAVNLERQNQQLAAQVLAQIPALQSQQFQGNENRQMQALQLVSQLPQLADRRLQLALQTMAPQSINPLSALALQNGYQYQGLQQQQQDQNFWNQIGQSIMKLILGG